MELIVKKYVFETDEQFVELANEWIVSERAEDRSVDFEQFHLPNVIDAEGVVDEGKKVDVVWYTTPPDWTEYEVDPSVPENKILGIDYNE